ncbi:MAG: ABC transporter permease [Gulosibacter sp.]|uniref:ABC transporter permease n=1 Tax=Gulosibacter sp. TaxID=2817531 RepID=UPI003F91DC4D
MKSNTQQLVRNYGLQLGIFVALVITLAFIAPTFRGDSAVYATLERLLLIGIITAGLTVTMIAAELDLSVAGQAVLAGVIAVQLGDLGLFPSIAIASAIGLLIGLFQGWLIAKIGINSLVFTVGMLTVLQGVAWLVANGGPVMLSNYMATDVLLARYWVFSPLSITAIVVVVAVGIFLTYSKWGREIYAVGGARHEAVAAGASVKRSMVLAFGISGFCAALAGGLSSLKGGSVTPDSFGAVMLTCVAAALIGGVSLTGGRGNVVNIVLGILIIVVLAAGLSAMGVASYFTELITGVLLLVVIVVEFIILRVARRNRIAKLREAHTTA